MSLTILFILNPHWKVSYRLSERKSLLSIAEDKQVKSKRFIIITNINIAFVHNVTGIPLGQRQLKQEHFDNNIILISIIQIIAQKIN